MQPTLHISIGVEYSLQHKRSSGARYHSVTTIGVYWRSGDPYSLANPKSPTFKKNTFQSAHKTKEIFLKISFLIKMCIL